jgi:Helix-turn-helix domain
MRLVLPNNHLRPRREKIFGPAPSHPLDRNAARVWAAAGAYNAAHRQPRQHWGPLTRATMDVLKTLLWRFHGADGGGRCFPSFERIAAAARCCRDTVCEAIKALEEARLLTWVHRITRIWRRERDLFGQLATMWQVIRTSNAYQLFDPLDRESGRRARKSENPTGPPNRDSKTNSVPVQVRAAKRSRRASHARRTSPGSVRAPGQVSHCSPTGARQRSPNAFDPGTARRNRSAHGCG